MEFILHKTMKDLIIGVKPLTVKNATISLRKQKPAIQFFIEKNLPPIERYSLTRNRLDSFDRKEKRNFFPERTLDLHGFTREEAFQALIRFFADCQQSGIRKVLIITGGHALRNSVIRASFQKWIRESFGNFVLKCSVSEIHHGGEGAFYVVLRKFSRF